MGTVRFVSKTGSSTPPYTSWETASDSIQKCINICGFGDTVYVANGVYKERIDMIPGLNLIGAGMDSCIVDTREFTYASGFYSIKVADSCLAAGLHIITYDNNHGFGFYIREQPGITINSTICNNKIEQATEGIAFSGFNTTNSSVFIYKNWILNVEVGILCMLNRPMVLENIIYPIMGGLASNINSSPTYLNNTIIMEKASNLSSGFSDFYDIISTVKNNLFVTLDNSGHVGIKAYSDTVINNNVIGPWTYGIATVGVINYDAVIKNNHIEKTQKALRYDYDTGAIPPLFKYNNLWGNQTNFTNFSADTTNSYNDPMFVSEDSADYHLQMYSPLIDAGDPTILDKDGSRSDIGLFGGSYGGSYKYLDLAPRSPVNLIAILDTNKIQLSWNRNTEADTAYYNVYRDTVQNFTIDSTKLITTQTDTFFVQPVPHNVERYVYKVTCVDNQGNESEPGEEVVLNLTAINDYPASIYDYVLYQNYPNPFNPVTKISYRLKESGYVKLYVYDIKGEVISVLVNQIQEAGFYEVGFSGQPAVGNQLASGIYIYQLMVRSENNIPIFSDLKKMIYLK